MRKNHMVMLSPQEQVAHAELLSEPVSEYIESMSGLADWEADVGAMCAFCGEHYDVFTRLPIWVSGVIEHGPAGPRVTGNSIINSLIQSTDSLVLEGRTYLIALPEGPRFFEEVDNPPAERQLHPDIPLQPLQLPPGYRLPTPEEVMKITNCWHAQLSIGDYLQPEAISESDAEDISVDLAWSLLENLDPEHIRLLGAPPYAPTPLSLLNVSLQQLLPGCMVLKTSGRLTWVIHEEGWKEGWKRESFWVPRSTMHDEDIHEGTWQEQERELADRESAWHDHGASDDGAKWEDLPF